jgi:hypothetical protein
MTTHTLPQPTKRPRRPGWVIGLVLAVASGLALVFRYRRTHPHQEAPASESTTLEGTPV